MNASKAVKATNVEKATAAWQGEMPDWVGVLAANCDVTSQAQVAIAISYSSPVVSAVISNTYKGNLQAVELAVRGAFNNLQAGCPVLGDIPMQRCLENQRLPFASHNPIRRELFYSCRAGCPHSRLKQEFSPCQRSTT